MDKTKWYAKPIYLLVAFALVFSLAGIAVLPVGAEDGKITVAVSTENTTYCCCDVFNVTATITVPAGAAATNVSAELSWDNPPCGIEWVAGENPREILVIEPEVPTTVEWTVHCLQPGDVEITVTVWADSPFEEPVSDTWVVTQESGDLKAVIIEPEMDEVIPACQCFNFTFYVENTGCNDVRSVFVVGDTFDGVEFGCSDEGIEPSGTYKSDSLGRLEKGEKSANVTVRMHCTEPGPGIIHIVPYGMDVCSDKEIVGESDIVEVVQVFGLTCEADPNPTKVCHNTTFTAEVGEGAMYPVGWEWDFNDGEDDSGTLADETENPFSVKHHYETAANYTACVDVTDQSGTTVQCCVPIRVYPALNVTCNVTPEITKLPHCLNFTAERVGGIPGLDYTWSWEITDEDAAVVVGNSTAEDFTWCPPSAGNYSGTVTLNDDLDPPNTANCTTEIARVYPALNVTCDAEPKITKVPHCINFTAERVGGLPETEVTYSWDWMIWNDDLGAVDQVKHDAQNYQWCPTSAGNYTGYVTVVDDFDPCNGACCNVSVRVYGGVNVTCDAEPDPAHVCHAVNFTAEVTGGWPAASYNWSWVFTNEDTHEEVGTSEEQNPSFTFMCVGNYSGFVTACDNLTPPNCGNCTANVTVTIFPPQLISPPLNAQLTSKNVTFEWEDIGCCNYTLEVWQKEEGGQKVLLVETGKDNTWTGPIFNGEWRWRVTATESCNISAVSDTWFFRVDQPGPAVTVMSPNGGEVWQSGDSHAITWAAVPTDGVIDIYYSSDNGGTWTQVAAGEVNDGAYPWTVPSLDSTQCLVRVVVTDAATGTAQDTSDGVFTITTDLTDPTVTVTSPNGGESYAAGSSQSINWTASDTGGLAINPIDLYFSSNGGAEWAIIATGEANDGTYSWTVPGVESDQCLVKVEASDAAGNVGSDTSDSVFSITITEETPPSVTVKTPNGGETWAGGSRQSITWKASDYWSTGGFAASADSDLTINIYYKYGGGAWTLIAAGEVNDGEYKWDVPEINDTQCLVRVDAVDAAGNVGSDTSDSEFTISTVVVVSIPDTAVSANTSVVVPININGVTDLAGFDIWLSYDNTVVNVTAVGDLDLSGVNHSIDNANGVTKINWYSGVGQSGDLACASVTMQAIGSAGDTSDLDLDVEALVDSNGVDILHGVEDGVFTILALMEGDATLDGHVTIADALFAIQHAVAIRTLNADQLKSGDTTDNGYPGNPVYVVTAADALHIAQWLVDPDQMLGVLGTPLWDATKDADMAMPVA